MANLIFGYVSTAPILQVHFWITFESSCDPVVS
jgi:hypothetical protein